MKKVLIWHTYDLLPKGGPSGYLYNIKKYCKKNNISNIVFLDELVDIKIFNKRNIFDKLINKLIKVFYFLNDKDNLKTFNLDLFIKGILDKNRLKLNIKKLDLSQYDYIHFHTTYELTKYFFLLKNLNFNGKIILTTHSPKPLFREIIEDWNNLKLEELPNNVVKELEKIDIFAYENADILIYPDINALEPYQKWNYYSKLISKNIKFIPTGINPEIIKIGSSKEDIRGKYNIPNDSIVISYVGRHNYVKGYDLLK